MENQIPSVTLAIIDYLIMVAYMLFLIAMSLYYRKFAQFSMDNFFLGGRNLKGWLNGTSYAATCMNADVAPAYCGMTVITGLYICWWYISRFGLALRSAFIAVVAWTGTG